MEGAAGLASGGLLLIGAALLVLQFVAPDLASGPGSAAATGPGWPRVGLQLAVGAGGEAVVQLRRWLPRPARWLAALGVLLAAAIVLWIAWWA